MKTLVNRMEKDRMRWLSNGMVSEEEYAFIVRACNSHADLLAALEACFDEMARGMGMSDRFDQICYNARAAILKAKE
mgnify:CR=1 FL=1